MKCPHCKREIYEDSELLVKVRGKGYEIVNNRYSLGDNQYSIGLNTKSGYRKTAHIRAVPVLVVAPK
jgi:hypothetical protein